MTILSLLHLQTLRALVVPFALVALLAACDSLEDRVAEHYARGQALLEEGVPEKAVLEFRNALQLDENHAPSHYAIGEIHEARGELQPAFQRYLKVTELEPGHFEAQLKTGRFYLLANELDKARTAIAAARTLDPARADVYAAAAGLALREDDPAAARTALDQALALDPNHEEAALVEVGYLIRTATLPAALARADQALTQYGGNLALHVLKLQILERQSDTVGIGAQLAAMIAAFPEETRFREARVRWAAQAGEDEIALEELRALAAARPADLPTAINLIRFVRQTADEEAALAELTRLIDAAPEPFQLELMRAQFDVEAGRHEEATNYLRALIERAGTNANTARVALARLLTSQGDPDGAGRLIETVLAEDPTEIEALVLKIARQIDDNQLDAAVQLVRRGLDEAPDDIRLLQLAARAQELSGNLDLASDRLAKAVRLSGYRAGAVERYAQFLLRANRVTAAETVLAEAIGRNPEDGDLVALLGFTRARLENWPGAEQAAAALARLDPERARQLKAAILIGQERFDEGADLLRDLPEDARQRTASVAALVQTYVHDGKTGEAVAFLDDLLAENPGNLQALGIRGNLHLAAGEMDTAEANYRAILEADPGHGGAHSALARLARLRGDAAAAEAQIRTGLEVSPDNILLLARLAQVHEIAGRFDDAIEIYERLYTQLPDSLVIANNLASLLSDHHGDDPAALTRAYAIAGRLERSDQPHYRDTFGWTRHLKGEHETALERIEPVAEALPGNPWVRYHLGMIYAALNRAGDARDTLETALTLVGDRPFPPAGQIRAALDGLAGQ